MKMRGFQIWLSYFSMSYPRKVNSDIHPLTFYSGIIIFVFVLLSLLLMDELLFHTNTGSNPIYNLLPDILGKLSNQNLKRESFCNVMQFLIGSIKKVKLTTQFLLQLSVFYYDLMVFLICRTNKWNLLLKSFAIGSVELQVRFPLILPFFFFCIK